MNNVQVKYYKIQDVAIFNIFNFNRCLLLNFHFIIPAKTSQIKVTV